MIKYPTTFLLVEDDEIDAERLRRAFAKLNITNKIVHAQDGVEALDILRGRDGASGLRGYVVILLDLNMPRMNGFEFLDELRGDPALTHTPVFVLTTSDREEDIEASYRKHVSGYLLKPVGMDNMIASMNVLSAYWNVCKLPSI